MCVPVPTDVGVWFTWRLAEFVVGLPMVHGEPVKVPVPPLPNETVPVGGVAPDADVSITVAVHVVCWFTTIVVEVQLTLVVVE